MDRLTTASTNAVGVGQYAPQTYTYNPATGNISSKSDVGAYTYSSTQPHAVTQAAANTYAYDQNGNMTSRTVDGVEWTYTYNADGQLTQTRKNNQLVSEYGYDGDGKRVWAKDYEGYSAGEFKETIYIGNYYEFVTEVLTPEPGAGGVCTGTYCSYLPMVFKSPQGISYYYADGQRIAMRDKNGVVSYLYGDQLGSVSAVADASGSLVSKTLYEPWGTTRYENGDDITEYGYTGQMQEGDIYFYNARWYDPQLGRFMQPDTIVPLQVQGTQAFDRYAYVNNNPMNYVDPGGDFAITTAILIGVGVGALVGYGGQVIHNLNNDMSFKEALTTDISVGWIVGGAVAGGVLGGVGFAALAHFGIIQATTATTAVGSSLCADGDCSNEINYLAERSLSTIDNVVSTVEKAPLRGQSHHIFSNRVWNVMSDSLKAAFGNNRNSLIVQGVDYEAHHGYQQWHRAVDNELVIFILKYSPNKEDFVNKLVELYTPLVERFPTVLDILNRIQ
jgi:RHS repeat-associated protein